MSTTAYKVDSTGYYKYTSGAWVAQSPTNGFLSVSSAVCTVQVTRGDAAISKSTTAPTQIFEGAQIGSVGGNNDGRARGVFANNAATPEQTWVASRNTGNLLEFVVIE